MTGLSPEQLASFKDILSQLGGTENFTS